jgi:RNA ligase
MEFVEFNKIARLSRNCVVTEKIDGTNASITITDTGEFLVGSRTRWITPEDDNYGFARWAHANKEELLKLGPGQHFGEWWGLGIQRNYGVKEKRFSLFNTARWSDDAIRPACCSVVPVLYSGLFDTVMINETIGTLRDLGSAAAPGFMKPEGIVVWHEAARIFFKKTIEKDEVPKGKQ